MNARHRIYGFTLASEFALPELVPADQNGPADVTIRRGRVAPHLPAPRRRGACYEVAPGRLLMWLDGVARFEVRDGVEIVVEVAPRADDASVRHLLLSSPLAGLVMQRGMLPLRASAIASARGAAAFLAPAAFGKSTLAAEFRRRGYGVLADDLTVVRLDPASQVASIEPSYPWLRLWPDALAKLGEDAASCARVRPESERRMLYCGGQFEAGARPLVTLYLLERGEVPPGAEPLSPVFGAQRIAAVLDLVYQLPFAFGFDWQRPLFENVAALVQSVRVVRVYTPANEFALGSLADRIERDWVS